MESEKEVSLELGPVAIFLACVQIAAWCVDHEAEIKSLAKKGWTSAKKIVEYLKKKYHKK